MVNKVESILFYTMAIIALIVCSMLYYNIDKINKITKHMQHIEQENAIKAEQIKALMGVYEERNF